MQPDIQRLLELVSLSHELQQVKRKILNRGEDSYENDMEHSFQLAFVSLYIINAHQLELDASKAMALGLVHDIVEVHAGDEPAIGRTKEAHQAKVERETKARAQLRQEWPEFTLLHDLIDEYEARQSPESKFVFALDKLLPMMNNYLDGGRSWHEIGVSLEQIRQLKIGKVDKDPLINTYYKELFALLEQRPDIIE